MSDQSIVDILGSHGIKVDANASLEDIAKAVKLAKRDLVSEKMAMLEQRKESNYSELCETAADFRATLESTFANFLPGTHANFTVRVTDKGVIATANDCHSTGKVESIHVTPSGNVVFGKDGAEAAKNVRARRKD